MLCKYCIELFEEIIQFQRSIFANLGEQILQNQRPRLISEPIVQNNNPTLYTSCSYEEITGDKLISSVSILPQTDQLPNMFTYVPLQRNFLVRLFE